MSDIEPSVAPDDTPRARLFVYEYSESDGDCGVYFQRLFATRELAERHAKLFGSAYGSVSQVEVETQPSTAKYQYQEKRDEHKSDRRPAVTDIGTPVWCSSCGHRWDRPLHGAELCGDCWRKAQDLVAALGYMKTALAKADAEIAKLRCQTHD
jgi:hypothetical protein